MEITQFIGFLVFLGVFTMGFWMMFFLLGFVVPYWVIGSMVEEFKLRKENKKNK